MPGADLNVRVGADITELQTKMAAAGTAVKEFGVASEVSVAGISKTQLAIEHLTSADDIAAHSIRSLGRELLHIGPALVFTSIIAGVDILLDLGKSFLKVGESSKIAGDEVSDFNQIQKDGYKNAAEDITKSKLLYEATQNTTLSLKERKQAVSELQKDYPEYFKNMTQETILAGQASDKYKELTKSILDTAFAEAAKDRIKAIVEAMLDSVIKVNEAEAKIKQITESGVGVPSNIPGRGGVLLQRFSTDQKDKDAAINNIKNLYADAYRTVDQGNARIDAIINGVGAKNILKNLIGDPAKAEELLNETFNIYKSNHERIIKLFEEEANNDANSQGARLRALKKYYDEQKELDNKSFQEEKRLINEKLALDIAAGGDKYSLTFNANQKIALAKVKHNNELLDLDHDYTKKSLAILDSYLKEKEKKLKQADANERQLEAAHTKEFLQREKEFNGLILKTIEEGVSNLSDALANIAVNGGGIGSLFDGIFKTMGAGLKELGQFFIKTGIEVKLFKDILTKNPILAIAAGVALEALGGIIEGSVAKRSAFATGVQNFQGGTAIVGERGPELLELPRGSNVIPNGKMNSIGNQHILISGEFKQRGTDMVLVLNRAQAFISRNG